MHLDPKHNLHLTTGFLIFWYLRKTVGGLLTTKGDTMKWIHFIITSNSLTTWLWYHDLWLTDIIWYIIMRSYHMISVYMSVFVFGSNYIVSGPTNFNYSAWVRLSVLKLALEFHTPTLSILTKDLFLLNFKSFYIFRFSYLFSAAWARFGLIRCNVFLGDASPWLN